VPKVRIQYDPEWNLPSLTIDSDGNRTEIIYTNGLPSRIKAFYSEAQSYDTTYSYNAAGLLVAVTNANGHVTEYTYDSAGNLSTAVAEIGPIVSNRYNSLGFVTRTEVFSESGTSSGRITQFERDSKGRIGKVIYADGLTSSNDYNELDCLISSVDRAGRVTDYTWAPTEKLTSVTKYLQQNGSNVPVRVSCNYDEQFNTLSITEPRGRYVESYQLDIQDRVTSVTNIEGQVMTIDYGVGDFVKRIVRFDGSVISNSYDSAGRKSLVACGTVDGSPAEVAYSYYADSQLKTVSDGITTISNTYDRLNRLTGARSQRTDVSVADSSLNYGYDAVGNVTNATLITDNNSLITLSYSYDSAERLKGIFTTEGTEMQRFAYAYSPINGCISSTTSLESGFVTAYSYDIMGRATNILYRSSNGWLHREFDYQYDALGMITNVVSRDGSSQLSVRRYEYDTLNRLVSEESIVQGRTSKAFYNYDLAGNRTSVVFSNNQAQITNNYALGVGDRLASWGTNGFALYDAAGNPTNLISNDGLELNLKWDERYRLEEVTTNHANDPKKARYSYDVVGRRVARSVAGGGATGSTNVEYYVYDGNQVVADLDANGNLLRTYIWGPGIDNLLSITLHPSTNSSSPVLHRVLPAPITYYALKDHLNSVLALTDADGVVVESYEYDAYGHTTILDGNGIPQVSSLGSPASSIGNRYMWQGREYDAETGLYYFRARWYSPETGRWLSKDPIGISGGLNLYDFCGNNPVNFVDPYGLCADDLSLSQANRHYRDGNGTPLYVDAASIRINGVYSSDFNSAGDRQLYTTKIFSKNGDFFVYGNITLEYAGNNQVNILPDNYGFEMHEGRPLRNIETKIGGFIAGEGTPYDIHFEGTVPIKPSR
jgi:RHS repeat-associated protein